MPLTFSGDVTKLSSNTLLAWSFVVFNVYECTMYSWLLSSSFTFTATGSRISFGILTMFYNVCSTCGDKVAVYGKRHHDCSREVAGQSLKRSWSLSP